MSDCKAWHELRPGDLVSVHHDDPNCVRVEIASRKGVMGVLERSNSANSSRRGTVVVIEGFGGSYFVRESAL